MKKETRKNDSLEVVFILDRSGSMAGLEDDTIGGFNATLSEQKERRGEVIWSTVLFDDQFEIIHDRVPVRKVKRMTNRQYYVRGCTALLDAIGRSINHIALTHKYARKGEVPGKTLFVITTDGLENSSREYSYRRVKQMIEKETEKYGWEFLFLGANMDAVREAGRLGIRADRSSSFVNDRAGIERNYRVLGNIMCEYADTGSIPDEALDEIREDYEKRG